MMASCLRLCLDMSMSPEAMETEETAVLGGELKKIKQVKIMKELRLLSKIEKSLC